MLVAQLLILCVILLLAFALQVPFVSAMLIVQRLILYVMLLLAVVEHVPVILTAIASLQLLFVI